MKLNTTYIIFLSFLSCNSFGTKNKDNKDRINSDSVVVTSDIQNKPVDKNEKEGFLHIDLNKLVKHQRTLVIMNEEKDTLILFNGDNVFFDDDASYKLIEEEYLYREKLKVNTFYAEYGLFILNCYNTQDGYYKVKVNNKFCFIEIDGNEEFLSFKTPERHVMESYPYLYGNGNTPLREEPNDKSKIIEGYDNYLYLPVEIQGDWLKIKDDKECYIGDNPSTTDIIGWVRWRKDNEIIIVLRHSC